MEIEPATNSSNSYASWIIRYLQTVYSKLQYWEDLKKEEFAKVLLLRLHSLIYLFIQNKKNNKLF